MGFRYNLNPVIKKGIDSDKALTTIDKFISTLSEKATEMGAVSNRLDSALNGVQVHLDTLTSARSTIKDADLAKESSKFIQQQILQQAASTLMSTANQMPAIALQLI